MCSTMYPNDKDMSLNRLKISQKYFKINLVGIENSPIFVF